MPVLSLHSLTYIRRATVARDGSAGLLYLHDYGTGYQHLIFQTHEHAKTWETELNTATQIPQRAPNTR